VLCGRVRIHAINVETPYRRINLGAAIRRSSRAIEGFQREFL
jgi:hypothetical protein